MILSKSKGILSIFKPDDKLVMSIAYSSKQQMKNTIGVWNRNFPDGYYIVVKPAILQPPKQVYKRPEYHDPVLRDDVRVTWIRPPAVYDNSFKSLYP